jgi:protein SCO1/2
VTLVHASGARWCWGAVAAAVALVLAVQTGCGGSAETTPASYGSIGAFKLRDQDGTVFGAPSLRGSPAVLNFIFTRCPDACPLFTARFHNLQAKIGTGVSFLSITTDPEFDSPEVLRTYANKYGASADSWRFLTGSLQSLEKSVIDAFLLYLGDRDVRTRPKLAEIVHGELFLLLDASSDVRGFFRADARGEKALLTSLSALRENSGRP